MSARRRRTGRCLCIALALGAPACKGAPRDVYRDGQAALAAGDLAAALRGFDTVPVSDLRYPEARLAAAALESRLRRHSEQLLLGLSLRGQWRNDEAIEAFRGALDAWPGNPETRQLIAATEQRKRMLGQLQDPGARAVAARPPMPSGSTAVALPRPAGEVAVRRAARAPDPSTAPPIGVAVPAGERPGPEPRATSTANETVGASEAAPRAAEPNATPPNATDPNATDPNATGPTATDPYESTPTRNQALVDSVGGELARIEAGMSTGNLEAVLADLFALHGRCPADARVGQRLARLLQQRGLLRYGQGHVADAISDWTRAVELDPSLAQASALREMASRELARPAR